MGERRTPKGAWLIVTLLFFFMAINFADKAVIGLVAVPLASARSRLSQGTFAGTPGNDEDAPIADLPAPTAEREGSTPKQPVLIDCALGPTAFQPSRSSIKPYQR